MTDLLVEEAQAKAEATLIENHAEEFDSLYALACERNGLGVVTVYRTVTRTVTELEAMTLVRHGWKIWEEDSL